MTTDTGTRAAERATLEAVRLLAISAGDSAGVEEIDLRLAEHDAAGVADDGALDADDQITVVKAVQRQSIAEMRLAMDFMFSALGVALGACQSLEPATLRDAIDGLRSAVKPNADDSPEDQASTIYVRDWAAAGLERVALAIETGRIKTALIHEAGHC